MSTKIKTKLQKLSMLQEYFNENEDKPRKIIKVEKNLEINLASKSKIHKKSSSIHYPMENTVEEESQKKEEIANSNTDEKDNKIIKLDLETLNDISKNNTINSENSSSGNLSNNIIFYYFSYFVFKILCFSQMNRLKIWR